MQTVKRHGLTSLAFLLRFSSILTRKTRQSHLSADAEHRGESGQRDELVHEVVALGHQAFLFPGDEHAAPGGYRQSM